MVILKKIKSRDFFFNETAFLFWCHALWKLGSSNCCIFEMKHATGMETCSKTYFLFIFNLVWIRIRKTSLFWLYNLMTSLWKPSIKRYHNWRMFHIDELNSCWSRSVEIYMFSVSVMLTMQPSWSLTPIKSVTACEKALQEKLCASGTRKETQEQGAG